MNNEYGIIAPAHTPQEIVGHLTGEANAMPGAAAVRERITALGNEPTGGAAEPFAERIRKEVVVWQDLFAGLKSKPRL